MGEMQDRQARPGLEWLPFARPMMFRRPMFLQPSAWLEHLPFAMWMIESHRPATVVELGTHHGPSYFAFCQAVLELGLDTSCYAVDTWEGDEHAGFYGQEVYEKVHAYNDTHYSAFSRLVRSTFDAAAEHFSDGSIDLLHIDGLHTLEAVAHDFETWKPKLSSRGIVIFHDINVRERGFGVFKLFEQLRGQYPAFWFVHGHGLGVLGVGPQQNETLEALFALRHGDERTLTSVREVFSRLGRACADAFAGIVARTPTPASVVELYKQRAIDVTAMAATERGRLLELLEGVRQDVGRLEGEFESQGRRHKAELEARFSEIAVLTRRLFDVELKLAQRSADWDRRDAQLQQVERDGGVRLLNRLRRLVGRAPLAVRRNPRQEDVEVIRASGEFAADWYVATYPDVAADGADPIEHYVLFGAAEGRDPSPQFSTRGYLDRYPDVREGGINPLAHFVLHGRDEGRNAGPVGDGD